ncbi:MAG: HAD family hydrolase [Candidatus Omnitrophica bacterium]|nr:HAD family hydrolase [Candidatus Omnitrophota bacterium]
MHVVFLDRDGVINAYPGDNGYVKCWKEFKFIPGAIEGIRKLNSKGFKLFVVSNQSGVRKGIYPEKALTDITIRMLKSLKKQKAHIDGVYYCTHRSEENCDCKKPKTGLLHKALAEHAVTCDASYFIGDSFMDMKAAREFGAKPILVLSGKEKIANRSKWEFEPDYIFDNLLIASHYICAHHSDKGLSAGA